jgi:hypothetical protein
MYHLPLSSGQHETSLVEKLEDLKGEKRVLLRHRQVVLVFVLVLVVERDGVLLLRRMIGDLLKMLLEILWVIFVGLGLVGTMLLRIFFFGRKSGFVAVEKSVRSVGLHY